MKQQIVLVLIAVTIVTAQGVHAKPQPNQAMAPATTPARHTLSEQDKQHLLHDDFAIVKTVREIPEPVLKQLVPDGKNVLDGMAEPGQPFQITDVLGPKPLPFRRLIFAALSQGYCLVYYEAGGFGYGEMVDFFRLPGPQASRVWTAQMKDARRLLSLPELRTEIRLGRYDTVHRF